jgi:hypothetical protein
MKTDKKKWVFDNGEVSLLINKQMQDDILNGQPYSSIPYGHQFWVWTPYKQEAVEKFAALCTYTHFIELVFDYCKGKSTELINKNNIHLN